MSRLYWFNAGYEEEMAVGVQHPRPGGNIRLMREELSLLPLWYGEAGDLVLTEGQVREAKEFVKDIPEAFPLMAKGVSRVELRSVSGGEYTGTPWGLSPQSCGLFEELRRESGGGIRIEAPAWRREYVELAHRRMAGHCLGLLSLGGCFEGIEAVIPTFLRDEEEVERYLSGALLPQVAKRPFSSSGRGLLRLDSGDVSAKARAWLRGAIRRQGSVGLERWLDKVRDFAMEFYVDEEGKAIYKGLSVFETDRGAYLGNRLESQKGLSKHLGEYIPEKRLQEISERVGEALCTLYGGRYTGYMGVDMLVYREWDRLAIHPCVEINMRYTMGMAALALHARYVHEEAGRGIFRISYSESAYTEHCAMEKASPRHWKAGRLWKGYLPLCPVGPETRYRAYLWLP
ncbi:MAG: hypothetical protein LBU08_03590 [Tannerellaceae bacterium]|jgi:hypothetical protein|nr:hypothetical protein [Tannerellaceae bacterium]